MKPATGYAILAAFFVFVLYTASRDTEGPLAGITTATTYPGCGNRDCECYEDCSCIDGICVCGGPKPPAPPKPKPKPAPDIPPDDVGPDAGIPASPKVAQTKPLIIMHTRDNCASCMQWWASEAPKFREADWVVALPHKIPANASDRTPFFTVEVGGKAIELQGYQTFENVKRVMR